MGTLPQFQDDDRTLQMLQNSWASMINPVLNNPLNNGNLLKNISLVSGTNVINHLLGRKLQGWIIVGINAAATIYDNQANNQTPDKTLILISSAAATVNIEVF